MMRGAKMKASNQVLISNWLVAKLIKENPVERQRIKLLDTFVKRCLKLKAPESPIRPNLSIVMK